MTMNGHNDLIANYLDGRMSAEAQEEFMLLVQRDLSLQREIEAEQAIRGMVQSDLSTIPILPSEPTTLIMTELAATGVSSSIGGSTSTGILSTIFGTSLGLSVVSIIGVLGVVLGILLAIPLFETEDQEVPVEQEKSNAQIQHEELSMEETNLLNVSDSAMNNSATSIPAVSAERKTRNGKETAEENPSTIVPQRQNIDVQKNREVAIENQSEKTKELLDYLQQEEEKEEIQVIKNDSVRLKLDIE